MSEVKTTAISIDVTKAELQVSLTKEGLQYQQLLQEGEDVKFTKENLAEQGGCLKTLRAVKKKLEEKENPYTANWKAWNDARRSLVQPIDELLTRKEKEYRTLANEIEEERKRAELEKARVDGIKQAIDNFFLSQSQAIAGAKTLQELTSIEKIIGSHKANKSRYAEFLPQLIERADSLTPLIKQQKDTIKKLEAIREEELKAEQSGDDQAVLEAIEKRESLQSKIEEVHIRVQEQAIDMATKPESVVVPEVVVAAAPRPRRQTWEWQVLDINETMRKMPSFVTLSPNKEKIDEYLKAKRAEGITGEEFMALGIKFYVKKSY